MVGMPFSPVPVLEHDGARVVIMCGDAEALDLGENTIDALCFDPPAGIEFMGAKWDGDRGGADQWSAWLAKQLAPSYRALKPGAHGLAWALPRVSDWTMRAIRLAGFEIRDVHHDVLDAHSGVAEFVDALDTVQRAALARLLEAGAPPIFYQLFGQGFPKSLDISKAIEARRLDDPRPVCRYLRAAMDAAGVTSADLAPEFGVHSRMVDHWAARDTDSQPTIPTPDQWAKLHELLGKHLGPDLDAEHARLCARKGTLGEAFGARTVVGSKEVPGRPGFAGADYNSENDARGGTSREVAITRPSTDAGARWEGWGTALKPAVEHWILFRKPLDGTYADNVLTHGTGALNIGACRIGTTDDLNGGRYSDNKQGHDGTTYGAGFNKRSSQDFVQPAGRWPAHLSLDEVGAAALDEQSGTLTSGKRNAGVRQGRRENQTYGDQRGNGGPEIAPSAGGASRFFYVAKPSRKEKDRGLDHLPASTGGEATGREDGSAGTRNPRAGAGRTGGARNVHPTVKSVDLMTWLLRLITPPGGVVLDPFAGSGTTGIAAIAEGFGFVGVEQGGPCAHRAPDGRPCRLERDAHTDDTGHEYDPKYLPILLGRIEDAITSRGKEGT